MEALICCAVPLVVFGVLALFGQQPQERRTLDRRLEEDHEHAYEERVS